MPLLRILATTVIFPSIALLSTRLVVIEAYRARASRNRNSRDAVTHHRPIVLVASTMMSVLLLAGSTPVRATPTHTVGFSLTATNVQGVALPSSQVAVGQDFLLNAFVQDLRAGSATGVFAAFLDVAYDNPTLFSLVFSETQRVTLSNNTTGGTYTLTFDANPTGPIALGASIGGATSNLLAALSGLPNVGTGTVEVVHNPFFDDQNPSNNNPFRWDVTFTEALAEMDLPLMIGDGSSLTFSTGSQPTATVDEIAKGVRTDAEAFRRSFTTGPDYPNGLTAEDGDRDSGGSLIDPNALSEVGSFDGAGFPGGTNGDPRLLWSVRFNANAAGIVTFTPNRADAPVVSDVLTFGTVDPVPPAMIDYDGPIAVTIVDGLATPTPTPGSTSTPTPTSVSTPIPLPTSLDHFMSYKVKPSRGAPKFIAFGPVQLSDQFGAAHYKIQKPVQLALPADKNGEGRVNEIVHLEEYKIKLAKGEPKFAKRRNVHILNQCNDLLLEVRKPVSMLVPTAKSLSAPPAPPDPASHVVDHYLCYSAKPQTKLPDKTKLPKFPKGIQVAVEDQFQTRRYDLKKITKLCNPAAKSGTPLLLKGKDKGLPKPITPSAPDQPEIHLVCYQAKLAKKLIAQDGCGPLDPGNKGVKLEPKQSKHTKRQGLFVANQFGTERLGTTKDVEFCIPSLKTLVP